MACLLRVTKRVSHVGGFSRLTRRYGSHFPIVYSDEVRVAKIDNKPLVALESTIITHGMPYPKNLETAIEVENIIRQQGATPATIAILNGQITVGLTKEQIKYLAQTEKVVKASRRDLAPIIAAKQDGATTVAGTMIVADLAEIPIFVTGGIGGVHREGENTMDISADLTELGRTKTLVVCSGVKSILDIGRTLEYLETQGVTVCAFGESDEFPAFYTRVSGHQAPHRAADATQAASILLTARNINLDSGIVIAVPVPEKFAMDENVIESAINNALLEAHKQGIRGKEITPFLLAAVAKATEGASLNTNIALIKNNAKVGADISVHFKKLKDGGSGDRSYNRPSTHSDKYSQISSRREFHTASVLGINQTEVNKIYDNTNRDVLVIGGANVDRSYRVTEDQVQRSHLWLDVRTSGQITPNLPH